MAPLCQQLPRQAGATPQVEQEPRQAVVWQCQKLYRTLCQGALRVLPQSVPWGSLLRSLAFVAQLTWISAIRELVVYFRASSEL